MGFTIVIPVPNAKIPIKYEKNIKGHPTHEFLHLINKPPVKPKATVKAPAMNAAIEML